MTIPDFDVVNRVKKIDEDVSAIANDTMEHTRILNEHSRILNEYTRILNAHTHILNEHTKFHDAHKRGIADLNRKVESGFAAIMARLPDKQ